MAFGETINMHHVPRWNPLGLGSRCHRVSFGGIF